MLFALPMIAGNLLQQFYNIADTLIVGQALGKNALAAVGSAYTLMTFLTSIFLGLSMGAGALFSIYLGKKDYASLRSAVWHALVLIFAATAALNILVYAFLDPILRFLQIPAELYDSMREYLVIIFAGLIATFLYNFFACLLRAVGNSVAPLWFLGAAALLNVGLDLLFVLMFSWGIAGAAIATVLAQYVSGIGILIYAILKCREFLPGKADRAFSRAMLAEILDLSLLTCAQQSAMNFGILLIQRLVDSFGPVTMAAFAAAVKIDSFAYLPVQDFGNAFSTFTAQNYGRGKKRAPQTGLPAGDHCQRGVFCRHFRARVYLCKSAHAHLRAGGGRRRYLRRAFCTCALRGRFMPASAACFALRVLPRRQAPRHVRRADGHLAWHARRAWPICWPGASERSVSGWRSPSAGCWPTSPATAITSAIREKLLPQDNA